MMKKKWLILISILVLVFAGVIWFNTSSEPPIVVDANLSPKDVADIKRIVRHELRRDVFREFSWKNVKALPHKIKDYSHLKVRYIHPAGKGFIAVCVLNRINTFIVFEQVYEFTNSSAKGWQLSDRYEMTLEDHNLVDGAKWYTH